VREKISEFFSFSSIGYNNDFFKSKIKSAPAAGDPFVPANSTSSTI